MKSAKELINIGLTIAVFGGTVLSGSCVEKTKQIPASPAASAPSGPRPPENLPITSLEMWRELPADERIHRLEELDYPKIPNFQPEKELASATAQFFCEEIGCLTTPEEMTKRVFFMNGVELLTTLQAERGWPHDMDEFERNRRRMEHVLPNGRILINVNVFNPFVEAVINQQPPPVSGQEKKRIEARVRKSVLLRNFSRLNETKETIDSKYLTSFHGLGSVTFTRMDGWKLVGQRRDGTTLELNGLADAVHELIVTSAGEGSGGYIGVEDYSDAAAVIEVINRRVGISRQEFIRYAQGELPLRDYLKKVSSQNPFGPNEQLAFAVLVDIGLIAEGIVPKEQREIHTRIILEIFLGIKTNE